MTKPNEAQILGRVECEVVRGRELTIAELNLRRVVGVMLLSALVGSVAGIFFPMERSTQKFNDKATGLNSEVKFNVMEITKTASSSSTQKFITLQSRAGTAYLETDTYTKKWKARFILATGFNAENIEWAEALMNEAKTILNAPEDAWLKIVNEQR